MKASNVSWIWAPAGAEDGPQAEVSIFKKASLAWNKQKNYLFDRKYTDVKQVAWGWFVVWVYTY